MIKKGLTAAVLIGASGVAMVHSAESQCRRGVPASDEREHQLFQQRSTR